MSPRYISNLRGAFVVWTLLVASVASAQPGAGEPVEPPTPVDPLPPPVEPPTVVPPTVAPPVAAPVVAGAVSEPADPEPIEVPTGFAFEARLETAQFLIDNDLALPTTQAGIFIGYRGPKITIGVGLELGRITESSDGGGISSERSVTQLLLIPGIRGVLASTADAKTEMLAQLDVGYGANWQSSDSDAMDPPSISHIRVQVGPSIRHWITPSFAVGATAGLRHDRLTRTADAGTGTTSDSTLSLTGMFSSLQIIGVF